MELNFFDCNCSIGMRGSVNPGSFYTREELIRKLSNYGIKKALVYHSMAREYAPSTGNKMLMDEIIDYPFLQPIWTVMPHHTREFPEPDKLIKEMKINGVKAVNMFPGATDHGYSLAEWNCGELLAALEKHRIPLFIGFEQFASWNELHDVCNQHPGLNIICTNVNYRVNRNLYPILNKFKNLYIETYGYKVHCGIEEICRLFGANRLVFGSGMPVFSGASAVCMLNYARISEKEKEMIAHQNLENLLGGVN